MEVILLEKVGRFGKLGDVASVKAGFARNYLFPKKLAVRATKQNIANIETRRAELEKASVEQLQAAQARGEKLQGLTVTISSRAADEGRLYGSIGTKSLAEAIVEAGVEVHKSEIRLPNGPLRQIGEFEVQVQLHADVSSNVKVIVVPAAA